MWVMKNDTDYTKYYGKTARITYVPGYNSHNTQTKGTLINIIKNEQNRVSVILDIQILHPHEKYLYTCKQTVCPNIISKIEINIPVELHLIPKTLIPKTKQGGTIHTLLAKRLGHDVCNVILGFTDNYIEI